MASNLKQIFEQFIAPSLQCFEGQFEALRSEIRRLDDKISNMNDSLNDKIDNLDKRLTERIDGFEKRLDIAINVHERLARLEAALGRH